MAFLSSRRNAPSNQRGDASLAQFFTPFELAKFICRAARVLAGGPGKNPRIIDPAAGKGVFLDAALGLGKVSADQVYGIEIDPELEARRSEGAKGARFFTGDGLLQEFPGVDTASFDLVVGNPPFGRMVDILPGKYLDQVGGSIEKWKRFSIWRLGNSGQGPESDQRILRKTAIDLLFVERAIQLARPGGVIALILPEGFFANTRLQRVRDWVLERAAVVGVMDLPDTVFRRCRANAKTEILFLRKRGKGRDGNDEALLVPRFPAVGSPGGSLRGKLEKVLAVLRTRDPKLGDGTFYLSEAKLRGARWDVEFWSERTRPPRLPGRFPLAPLGEYIEHLTYGPIVTGRRPQYAGEGIRVIGQGDFAETGLHFERGMYVPVGSEFDPLRSRVRNGDLLLPRSGAGTLGKNRLAVYLGSEPANIGCFVDLIRLAGINPFFVWFFFKTRPGWAQIRSIINGVGTPNINFSEIRALVIPVLPPREQENLERRYLEEVWPLHCRRAEGEAVRAEGESRFRRITEDLEQLLAGRNQRRDNVDEGQVEAHFVTGQEIHDP